MAKRYLTLDIGAANVALAEYEAGANGAPKLLKYGIARLAASVDSGDASTILAPALLEIVREKGIKPGPVAISVSGQMVFPRFAAIPPSGGSDKFEQMIRYEIEQNVPFPIDEMICDRQVLGDTAGGDKSVMIVAAKTEQIEAITDAVTAAGFRPELVDVAPIALTNAVRKATGETGCVVILDIGAKTTSLVISEGDTLYNRSIPIAGNTLTREIAQALGCSQEEAEEIKVNGGYVSLGGVSEDADETLDKVSKVARAVMTRIQAEISRSVNFYRSQQGGSAPVRLYLTGGTALMPQADAFFSEALQVEVACFSAFDLAEAGAGVDAEAAAADGAMLVPTVGLALHMAGAAEFAINLLPPSIVAHRADRAKVPVVAAAGVALVAALGLFLMAAQKEAAVLTASAEAAERGLSALNGFKKKVAQGEASVVAAQEKAEGLRKLLAARTAAVTRMAAIRDAVSVSDGMWIERIDEGRVTVRGWKDSLKKLESDTAAKNPGKHPNAPEIVAERLKGNAAVDASRVKIADMTEVGRDGLVQQFTVELAFK